jgi:type I restriction enzyme, S subunit
MTDWQTIPLREVLEHRKEFITIEDRKAYKRPRVQLHARGILLRDNVSGALIKTKKQQVARAGEFLVAEIDAKVGGFGILPDDLDGAIVSSHYFLFRNRPECLDNKYLGWFIKTAAFRQQVEAQGSTNYAAIRAADVLTYEIPLPPLSEQQRIVARIDDLFAKIKEAQNLRGEAAEEANALIVSYHVAASSSPARPLSDYLELHEEMTQIKLGIQYPQVGVRGFGKGLFAKSAVIGGETTYPLSTAFIPTRS